MPGPETQLNLPEISREAKREIPEFIAEEYRAIERIKDPSIPRPVRPIYNFLITKTPDLQPQHRDPEMVNWEYLRQLMLGQTNFPRWVKSVNIGGTNHTLAWYSVAESGGESIHFRTLRCSCSLPPAKEPETLDYKPCPAKNSEIFSRGEAFNKMLGADSSYSNIGAVTDLLKEFVKEAQTDPFMWPPSHRSDALLVGGLSVALGVSQKLILEAAKTLETEKLVVIRDGEYPIITFTLN